MKKYKYYIIITIAFLVVALILFLKEKPGTLKVSNRIFAVADTSEVTTIRFGNTKNEIILERSGACWMVNKSFNAKSHAVKRLLYLLMNMEIHSPVPNSMRKAALQSFDKGFLKVLVESQGRVLKSYRIAESDSLGLGSISILEGDNDPYVVSVPGYDGLLSPLFITEPGFWRDKSVFRYQPAEILSIEIKYPDLPSASFVYNFNGFDNISIKSLADNRSVKISKEIARDFLIRFASVSYESQIGERSKQIFDSLSRQKPYCEISIKNTYNQERKVKTYRISDGDKDGSFNLNLMYAVLQNDTTPVVVKYADFDLIMKHYSDFSAK